MNPFSERFLLLKVKEVLLWNSHDTILSFDSPCWPTTIDSHYILLRWGIPAQFSSVQSLSHVQLFVIPWTAACQASLSITSSQNLLKLISIKLVMPSNHLIICHPLLHLPSIFPSARVFSKTLHQVANVLKFQLQHQSFQWIFRTDFLEDWLVGSLCRFSTGDPRKINLEVFCKSDFTY